MSRIQGLLRLAVLQSAEEVVLREGEAPMLRVAGIVRRLSMPLVDATMVRETLREVVGEEVGPAEGEERFPVEGHGLVRARWRKAPRWEATFGVPKPGRREEPEAAPAGTPGGGPSGPSPVVPSGSADAGGTGGPASAAGVAGAGDGRVGEGEPLGRALGSALARGASDLILAESAPITMKVGGDLLRLGEETELGPGTVRAMIRPLLPPARLATWDREGSVDFAVELTRLGRPPARFRGSVFATLGGTSVVLRPIRDAVPTLAELRLPDTLGRLVDVHDGLLLVVGPAGSGKSSTVAALVEHLGRGVPRHVITLEDPIEFAFSSHRSLVQQREVGTHVTSFAAGLRAALRESPDVLLVGEMGDPETIAAALTAAETGHLVLSTLHAGSAAGALDRIADALPEHQQRQLRSQLADVLRAVVYQRLLPARDGGRVPALEIVPVTPAIGNLIREGKTYQIPQLVQMGREAGMVPFARSVEELVRAGLVTREAAGRWGGS